MVSTNVLVTGIGGGSFGEQILKALKLSDIRLSIIGTDITNICFNKNNVDKFITIPPVSYSNYGSCIRNIIKNYKIKAIFPGSEQELKYFSQNIKDYKDVYISINSKELIDLCSNKFKTYEKLSEFNFLLPKYQKINNLFDCGNIDYFPVVLKPNTNSGGSAHIYIAFDENELIMFASYMLKNNIDIVAQEYIGNSENEYTIGVSADMNGNIIGSIILKRILNNGLSISKKINSNNRNIVISSGISQGEFVFDDNIKNQAETIAKSLNSKGPMNIQGRLVNGKLLVFEINPRLSGTTSLRAMVGYNEPANMIKQNVLHENFEYTYVNKIILRSITESIETL